MQWFQPSKTENWDNHGSIPAKHREKNKYSSIPHSRQQRLSEEPSTSSDTWLWQDAWSWMSASSPFPGGVSKKTKEGFQTFLPAQ